MITKKFFFNSILLLSLASMLRSASPNTEKSNFFKNNYLRIINLKNNVNRYANSKLKSNNFTKKLKDKFSKQIINIKNNKKFIMGLAITAYSTYKQTKSLGSRAISKAFCPKSTLSSNHLGLSHTLDLLTRVNTIKDENTVNVIHSTPNTELDNITIPAISWDNSTIKNINFTKTGISNSFPVTQEKLPSLIDFLKKPSVEKGEVWKLLGKKIVSFAQNIF